MPNITLAISDALHKKLRSHNEIRWSEVIRQVLQKNLEQLEMMDEIVKKSKFSARNIEEIGDKIKEGIARRHGLE